MRLLAQSSPALDHPVARDAPTDRRTRSRSWADNVYRDQDGSRADGPVAGVECDLGRQQTLNWSADTVGALRALDGLVLRLAEVDRCAVRSDWWLRLLRVTLLAELTPRLLG